MTKKNKELVHGLTESVDLKDWDFAILIAALKVYIKDAKMTRKSPAVIAYAVQLREKMRRPFVRLVKRTKREHRRLELLAENYQDLTSYMEGVE